MQLPTYLPTCAIEDQETKKGNGHTVFLKVLATMMKVHL